MRLIGHRGARGEAPENTLSGFRYLRGLGVRAVELDILVSADQQLVVIHDSFIDRTTLSHGRVDALTAAELAAVNATRRRFPDWPEIGGVPSLRDVMEVLRDFEHVQFEVKARSEEEALFVAEAFPPLWREFGFGDRAFTTSFNPHYLDYVRQAAPEIPRGFLFELDFSLDPVAIAKALGCRSLGPHQERCTPDLVASANEAGLTVSTWTVNRIARMRELAEMGVDGVITDLPALALAEARDLFQA